MLDEAIAQNALITSVAIEEGTEVGLEHESHPIWLAVIRSKKALKPEERRRLAEWLRVRLQVDSVEIIFRDKPE